MCACNAVQDILDEQVSDPAPLPRPAKEAAPAEAVPSSQMTKHAYRIGLSGTETKAGLEGVDKAQVNKVIYEVRSLLDRQLPAAMSNTNLLLLRYARACLPRRAALRSVATRSSSRRSSPRDSLLLCR